MRFGTYVFRISPELKADHQIIENTLREVELAEEIGLDAVWLTEHHFDGAVAYADPVVFAAAVAAKTKKVRIGFAVVEMALHHPVRLAAQTALLDNLSHGRLIMGTGRGSAYNEYEYLGFGLPMEDSRDMLPEAEELLIKAWTCENVRHEGRFWKVSFPAVRPQPYQTPHPPLVRACISEGSVAEMAKIGRPILMGIQTIDTWRQRLQLYGDTMLGAGFEEPAAENALDENWVQRGLFMADSYEAAAEVAAPCLERYHHHLVDARRKYNPGGEPAQPPSQPLNPNQVLDTAFLLGPPKRVVEQIAEMREAGVRNIMLNVNMGNIPQEQVERSMRLFGEQVLPKVRSL